MNENLLENRGRLQQIDIQVKEAKSRLTVAEELIRVIENKETQKKFGLLAMILLLGIIDFSIFVLKIIS